MTDTLDVEGVRQILAAARAIVASHGGQVGQLWTDLGGVYDKCAELEAERDHLQTLLDEQSTVLYDTEKEYLAIVESRDEAIAGLQEQLRAASAEISLRNEASTAWPAKDCIDMLEGWRRAYYREARGIVSEDEALALMDFARGQLIEMSEQMRWRDVMRWHPKEGPEYIEDAEWPDEGQPILVMIQSATSETIEYRHHTSSSWPSFGLRWRPADPIPPLPLESGDG